MTEKTLAEDTAAFEDTTQDCLAIQAKAADFEAYNKSLSEELEALAKAKDVISEKTDDSEYRDNRSMLSSRGGLAIELTKSEHSIGLTQLASRVDSAMHAETSNGDDPFAKVKGLISDMIARLEEKASEDATHKAFEATHIFNSMHSEIEMMRYMTMSQHKDLYLTTSMISFVTRSWPEVMNSYHCDPASNTINYREMLNPCKTSFDTFSLQPTNGASGEYAGLLVISKYQESIGQDLGMKSAHGMNPDSAVMPHISMKIKWIDDGVPLDELKRTRQEAEDVDDVQNIEKIAVKSCKSPDYSGWNGWQNIVIETEYGDALVDKTDENSQSLEMYDAMRKTTESEREAKDQITEQANKYARNGGRRYLEPSESLSKIESVESKVENEKLSVKMRLTKAISWSHAKFGDEAEKPISDDAKKALAEETQLLESMLEQSSKSGRTGLIYEALKTKPQMRKKVHQIKERREVLEEPQELSKENRKDDTELMDFAARFGRQDIAVQLQQDTRSPETAQLGALQRRAAEEAKNAEEKPFLEENHKWVNSKTREELYFISATLACGQLQQSGAYPTNEDSMQFTW